jgi:NTP pyrophosphatase (non-canonical NTP hydrolase)
MKSDINDILKKIIEFRDRRDWKKFHNPKDLAISLSIESNELLECFQWKGIDEVNMMILGSDKIRIQEEIADVAIYLLLLCNETNIDLTDAIFDKLQKNEEKYSVEKSRGNAKKYDELG